MVLKNAFKGYKIGGEVHKNLRNFSILHESFTATWEFAKFWEVGRSNFGEKFSIFFYSRDISCVDQIVTMAYSNLVRIPAILLYPWYTQL